LTLRPLLILTTTVTNRSQKIIQETIQETLEQHASEQAEEIERLKAENETLALEGVNDSQAAFESLSWIFNECGTGEELRSCGPTLKDREKYIIAYIQSIRTQLQQATEQGALPIENDEWRKQAIREMREDIYPAAPQPEAKEASYGYDPHVALQSRIEPSPSLPAGDREAAPAESGKPMHRIARALGIIIDEWGSNLTDDHIADRVESQLAQLAKYKRDAEAWEELVKHNLEVSITATGFYEVTTRDKRHGRSCKHPYSLPHAVLAFAAQLE
jgi:hypothetical protein